MFGFCIADCSGTGSNTNANQAVQVMSDLKMHNNGEFACNGGAFFWVAEHDIGGLWSATVYGEGESRRSPFIIVILFTVLSWACMTTQVPVTSIYTFVLFIFAKVDISNI